VALHKVGFHQTMHPFVFSMHDKTLYGFCDTLWQH